MLDRPTLPTSVNPPGVDDLVLRWQRDHDERARDRLTREYWPLIQTLGRRCARRRELDSDDAIQEAALGFLRALDTYDPAGGSKLSSYATYWIKSKTGRLADMESTIHVPQHVIDRDRVVRRATGKLYRKLGRFPTPEEIAADMGVAVERVRDVLESRLMIGGTVSASMPVGEEDGELELGDTFAADEDTRPDVTVIGQHETGRARTAILQAVELLPERWRKIVALRFVQGLTLTEVGEALGVTRERIRQLEPKAIARLREALRYDARALNLIGLEVEAPKTITRADAHGLGIGDLTAMTGLNAGQIDSAIVAGTFPAPVDHASHRGARIWDPAEVERWIVQRDSGTLPELPATRKNRPRAVRPGRAGIGSAEVARLAGVSVRSIHNWVAEGRFPEPTVKKAHSWRWDAATVETWMAHRDANGGPPAAEETSPGIAAPEVSEAPLRRSGGSLAAEEAPGGASARPTAAPVPRPAYAPALAHALMGGCSLMAIFAAHDLRDAK